MPNAMSSYQPQLISPKPREKLNGRISNRFYGSLFERGIGTESPLEAPGAYEEVYELQKNEM